jgi:voltage-gated potassium channel Kch
VLDHDADMIEAARAFGYKVFYGDATRLDLLRTARGRHGPGSWSRSTTASNRCASWTWCASTSPGWSSWPAPAT